MKKSLLAVFLLFFALSPITVLAEQKIVFSVKSIEYNTGWRSLCQKLCSQEDQDIDFYLRNGWRIVASSSRTVNTGAVGGVKCFCVGTEYVIEKNK
jgi:hypothetical protein